MGSWVWNYFERVAGGNPEPEGGITVVGQDDGGVASNYTTRKNFAKRQSDRSAVVFSPYSYR